MSSARQEAVSAPSRRIPANVILLGLVSLFNDLASEMIYPVMPIFLTQVLGAPVTAVGLIEGIAEATASITKFVFGYVSDALRHRKAFVVAGYMFGTVSKYLISLAYSWPLVLVARFVDRTGKGLRTAPRDSLLLENSGSANRGFIFGLHRAMDSLGAVLGPAVALILVGVFRDNLRTVFLLAVIPSAIGVLLLTLFVTEKGKAVSGPVRFPRLSLRNTQNELKYFLLVSFVFTVGNSSDAFLLLKAKEVGLTTALVIVVYILYNTSQSLFAAPAGALADRIGAERVFAGGMLIFAVVYFLFGLSRSPVWMWVLFPVYGLYIAATDGVSKAYISEFFGAHESGTFFGLHQTVLAVAGFIASSVGGLLWTVIGSTATLWFGSVMAVLAFVMFTFRRPQR